VKGWTDAVHLVHQGKEGWGKSGGGGGRELLYSEKLVVKKEGTSKKFTGKGWRNLSGKGGGGGGGSLDLV